MAVPGTAQFQAEEERIRAVYAQRADSHRYSWFNPGYLYAMQSLEREILALLRRQGMVSLKELRVFEVGCGTAFWLRQFATWGARPENLSGIDLLPDRIAAARQICPPGMELRCESATSINAADNGYDLVLQNTVFTSILDDRVRRKVADEMLRITKPQGLMLWYDFHANNPWNPHVRGIKKRELQRLFAGCRIQLRSTTLAPPLARRLAPLSWTLCGLLEKIPALCTHYLAAIWKPGEVTA